MDCSDEVKKIPCIIVVKSPLNHLFWWLNQVKSQVFHVKWTHLKISLDSHLPTGHPSNLHREDCQGWHHSKGCGWGGAGFDLDAIQQPTSSKIRYSCVLLDSDTPIRNHHYTYVRYIFYTYINTYTYTQSYQLNKCIFAYNIFITNSYMRQREYIYI